MTDHNFIIDGVLCYISSARNSLGEQTIVAACQSFYSGEEILQAKEKFYKFVGDKPPNRRGNSKTLSDLTDIIALFRKLDDSDFAFPRFFCDSYRGMPPASGFELIADHIIGLVSQIEELKTTVKSLESQISENNLKEIKEELRDIKLELKIRSQTTEQSSTSRRSFNSKTGNSAGPDSVKRKPSKVPAVKNIPTEGDSSSSNITAGSAAQTKGDDVQELQKETASTDADKDDMQSSYTWKLVNGKKRNKGSIIGSRQVSANLKGIQSTRDLFVGRCESSVTVADIKTYVESEFDIKVLNCEVISREAAEAKAFKVQVKEHEREKMLNPDKWPQNIVVRKFFNRKSKPNSNNVQ